MRLLIKGYLKEEYQQTAYATNVYVVPGQLAARFIHETREKIVNASRPMLEMTFVKQMPKPRGRLKKNLEDEEDGDITPPAKKRKTGNGKGKGKKSDDIDDDDDDVTLDHMYVDNPRPRKNQAAPRPTTKNRNKRGDNVDEDSEYETIEVDVIEDTSDEDSNEVIYDWSMSLREEPVARRKKKVGNGHSQFPPDDEILVLSD